MSLSVILTVTRKPPQQRAIALGQLFPTTVIDTTDAQADRASVLDSRSISEDSAVSRPDGMNQFSNKRPVSSKADGGKKGIHGDGDVIFHGSAV